MGGIDTSGVSLAGRSGTSERGLSLFLIRLIFFGLVYLSVRSVIEWATPFYVGSDQLSGKLDLLEMQKEPPSVFFIGSSRTHFHFNPVLFDSVVSRGGDGTVRSFNLSQGNVSEYESVDIARELLRSGRAPACRTIFIEFNYNRPEAVWDGDLKQKERFFHRMDPAMFIFHAGAILRAEDLGFANKVKRLLGLVRIIGLKYFGVGRFRHLLMGTQGWKFPNESVIRGRGFEYGQSRFAGKPADSQRIPKRLDTSLFRMKAQAIRSERSLHVGYTDRIFDSYFDDFAREAAEKGVRVFYTVQPNVTSPLRTLSVPNDLSDRVIDMSDPDEFPELYDWTLYNDNLHLNASGADIITTRLAEIYLEKISAAQLDGNGSSF